MEVQTRLFDPQLSFFDAFEPERGLFLSRLWLNPKSRLVRRDLGDCHALHRSAMKAFPVTDKPAREEFGVLYRLEADERRNRLVLLVQSYVAPNWAQLPVDRNGQPYCLAAPESKRVEDSFLALRSGRRLLFRLRANPTYCKSSGKQSGRRGKPLAVFGEENQLAWLQRQGTVGGFRVESARVWPDISSSDKRAPNSSVGWQQGHKDAGGNPLTFGAGVFEGELVITDDALFQAALRNGIGRGKAYGFGLLSLAPAAVSPHTRG